MPKIYYLTALFFMLLLQLRNLCVAVRVFQPWNDPAKFSIEDLRCQQPIFRSGCTANPAKSALLYAFNKKTNECTEMPPADCPKFTNRFESKEECLKACTNNTVMTRIEMRRHFPQNTQQLCLSPPYAAYRVNCTEPCGGCKRYVYKFDPITYKCHTLIVTGGGLAHNVFSSHSACVDKCSASR